MVGPYIMSHNSLHLAVQSRIDALKVDPETT